MGASGLLIVPAGFNTSTGLAGFTTAGLPAHVLGTTLTVPAGKGFSGTGTISDPVAVRKGRSRPPAASINLNNGLTLSAGGSVTLGSGNVTVNDAASAIGGGTLSAANMYVGSGGTGAFTPFRRDKQALQQSCILGYNSGDSGQL